MDIKGKYIYGIINSDKELFFGPCGIGACEEVYNIIYQDISAVVSDSEIADYTHMLKDTLARRLVRHQKVIEKIMPKYSIIPMRLGTFALHEIEIKDILKRGYKIIKEIFEKISDKIEIDIACTWSDFDSALKEAAEDEEVRAFKAKLIAHSERITVDEQMRAGFMVKKALDKKRDECAFEIQEALKTVSEDQRSHELMDDKMVINTAFLINKDNREKFDRKVEELNARFNERLNFRCVGPLPAYSFYTLELEKMEFEEVNWARKILGLNDVITKEEIKKAYQRMSFALHPDKNPNVSRAEGQFDNVNKAYKILTDYSLAAEQAGRGDYYSFNADEFKKNALLVKVKD